jgi:hypothetical protein
MIVGFCWCMEFWQGRFSAAQLQTDRDQLKITFVFLKVYEEVQKFPEERRFPTFVP